MGCPNTGTLIADQFIAFKTPLSSAFDNRISKALRWSTASVFSHMKETNVSSHTPCPYLPCSFVDSSVDLTWKKYILYYLLWLFPYYFQVKLGLWIDLTNTERYYSRAEVDKAGVAYVKLKIGGGAEVPSATELEEFYQHCHQFFATNPNSVIGVHCTLIVTYKLSKKIEPVGQRLNSCLM